LTRCATIILELISINQYIMNIFHSAWREAAARGGRGESFDTRAKRAGPEPPGGVEPSAARRRLPEGFIERLHKLAARKKAKSRVDAGTLMDPGHERRAVHEGIIGNGGRILALVTDNSLTSLTNKPLVAAEPPTTI
jgi:hypothetical protein